MTTTPAPLDLDAIRARLLNATEGPWAVWPDLRPEGLITIGDATGVIPEGADWTDGPSNTVAHVYTEEDAEFIRHAPEDVRALLDELADERRQGAAMASITGEAIRQISEERDAAREELATATLQRNTWHEMWQQRMAEVEALTPMLAAARADLSEDFHSASRCGAEGPECPGCVLEKTREELAKVSAELAELAAPEALAVISAAMDAVTNLLVLHPTIRDSKPGWFHESTLRLVAAVDAFALPADAPQEANPATTAEPGAPKATCGCGRPTTNGVCTFHGRALIDATPAQVRP